MLAHARYCRGNLGRGKMTVRRRSAPSEEQAVDAAPATSLQRPARILLCEDDAEMRALLAWSLRRRHYDVTECVDGSELASKLGAHVVFGEEAHFDLVISDIRMPGATALEVLEAMHDFEELPPVILITSFGDAHTHNEAKRLGVAALFDKPFEISDLLIKARELLAEERARTPSDRSQSTSPTANDRCSRAGAEPESGSTSGENCARSETEEP